MNRSTHPEVFVGKGVLIIYSKFTGEHPCRSAISIKLQSNFIKLALRHGCSPVNLLHIFRTPFSQNTIGRLLLIESVLLYFVVIEYFNRGKCRSEELMNYIIYICVCLYIKDMQFSIFICIFSKYYLRRFLKFKISLRFLAYNLLHLDTCQLIS